VLRIKPLKIKQLGKYGFDRAPCKKDVKNEGRSGDIYENKGLRKSSAGRSGYVDENKLVNG
jgi:hypothetical protein